MLDDGDGRRLRRIELGAQFVSRVCVVEIVVGERLALHLLGGGDAEALLGRLIERRPLMRVLAVAQRARERTGDDALLWRVLV